jgi:hypothetical protein
MRKPITGAVSLTFDKTYGAGFVLSLWKLCGALWKRHRGGVIVIESS